MTALSCVRVHGNLGDTLSGTRCSRVCPLPCASCPASPSLSRVAWTSLPRACGPSSGPSVLRSATTAISPSGDPLLVARHTLPLPATRLFAQRRGRAVAPSALPGFFFLWRFPSRAPSQWETHGSPGFTAVPCNGVSCSQTPAVFGPMANSRTSLLPSPRSKGSALTPASRGCSRNYTDLGAQ